MQQRVNEHVGNKPGIKSIDEEVGELVSMIREAQERIGEVEAEVKPVIDAAKERLKMLLAYRGESWSDDEGYARIVTDSVRCSYDAKGLDKLILEDPEKYGWLREYRHEYPVRGGVTVK